MSRRNVRRLIVVEGQKGVSPLSQPSTHNRLLALAPEGHVQLSVHFPPIPAPRSTRRRVRIVAKRTPPRQKCTSPVSLQPDVHFTCFLAARRALRPIPCSQTCTSPDSLQGLHFVQGNRGNARQKARRTPVSACTSAVSLQPVVHFACFLARVHGNAMIWGKCTSSCRKSGEVHVPHSKRMSSCNDLGGSARSRTRSAQI